MLLLWNKFTLCICCPTKDMKDAKIKFPIKTPTTKEEYYYRSLFSNHFPSNTAAMSVPQEPSVACSTKIALEWDEAFKLINEPSGRAISKVHDFQQLHNFLKRHCFGICHH